MYKVFVNEKKLLISKNQENLEKSISFESFTTLEIALLLHENIVYQRKIDPVTTFHELTIRKKHFLIK